jgi:hypothetical protein
MAARRCPKCKLISPGTASVCDCGWSFVEEHQTAPRRQPGRDDQIRRERRSRGTVQLIFGALLFMSGSYGGAGSVREAPSSVPALASAKALGGNFALLIMIIAGSS